MNKKDRIAIVVTTALLKSLLLIFSIMIGLLSTLAFEGVVDFLTQVVQIESRENTPPSPILGLLGIFVSIAFGIYVGKKIYKTLTTKPSFHSIKKTSIIILAKLLIVTVIFAVSIIPITMYLYSLELSSDLRVSMIANMTMKLLFLSIIFGFISKPAILKSTIPSNQ